MWIIPSKDSPTLFYGGLIVEEAIARSECEELIRFSSDRNKHSRTRSVVNFPQFNY